MSRHTRHHLSLATMPIIAAMYGQHFYAPGDEGGTGGGAGKGTGEPAADDKSKAKKIELTEDELNGRISAATEAAVKAAEQKAAAAAKKKADDDAAKLAKEQGDFKKLYDGEVELKKKAEQERDEARAAARSKDIDLTLSRYLAANHKDYVDSAEWIRPAIKCEPDASDEQIEKAVTEVTDRYVKANPRDGKPVKQNIPSAVRGGKVTAGGARQTVTAGGDDEPRPQPQGKWDHLDKRF